jgi:serine/threonine protein kinase
MMKTMVLHSVMIIATSFVIMASANAPYLLTGNPFIYVANHSNVSRSVVEKLMTPIISYRVHGLSFGWPIMCCDGRRASYGPGSIGEYAVPLSVADRPLPEGAVTWKLEYVTFITTVSLWTDCCPNRATPYNYSVELYRDMDPLSRRPVSLANSSDGYPGEHVATLREMTPDIAILNFVDIDHSKNISTVMEGITHVSLAEESNRLGNLTILENNIRYWVTVRHQANCTDDYHVTIPYKCVTPYGITPSRHRSDWHPNSTMQKFSNLPGGWSTDWNVASHRMFYEYNNSMMIFVFLSPVYKEPNPPPSSSSSSRKSAVPLARSSNTTPTPPPKSIGMSVVIGIAITGSLVAVAAASMVLFLVYRHKTKARNNTSGSGMDINLANFPGVSTTSTSAVYSLSAGLMSMLPGNGSAVSCTGTLMGSTASSLSSIEMRVACPSRGNAMSMTAVSLRGIPAAMEEGSIGIPFDELVEIYPSDVSVRGMQIAVGDTMRGIATFRITARQRRIQYFVRSPLPLVLQQYEMFISAISGVDADGRALEPGQALDEQLANTPLDKRHPSKELSGELGPGGIAVVAVYVIPRMYTTRVPYVEISIGSTKLSPRASAALTHEGSNVTSATKTRASVVLQMPNGDVHLPQSPLTRNVVRSSVAVKSGAGDESGIGGGNNNSTAAPVYSAAAVGVRVSVAPDIILDMEDVQLRGKIGEGAFGIVFRGTWNSVDVAMKVMRCAVAGDAEFASMKRELEAHRKLVCPHIVQLIGFARQDDKIAIITEYAKYGSIDRLLSRARNGKQLAPIEEKPDNSSGATTTNRGTAGASASSSSSTASAKADSLVVKDRQSFERLLPLQQRLKFALDTARGMEYLENMHIVHRDLKPGNVLVVILMSIDDDGAACCKLTDFGTAKTADEDAGMAGMHATKCVGTPVYMAPEILNGVKNRYTHKSDVYAYAITLHSILSGDEPYADATSGMQVENDVVAGRRMPLNIVTSVAGQKLSNLVALCWDPNPASRPSFSTVVKVLKKELADYTCTHTRPSTHTQGSIK